MGIWETYAVDTTAERNGRWVKFRGGAELLIRAQVSD